MLKEFMLVQFRKTQTGYSVTLLVLLMYVLLKNTPHAGFDIFIVLLSALHAFIVGNLLFQGQASDQAFLFSLPMSRRSIFLHRMLLGWALQAVTLLCVCVLIASGARCMLQRLIHSPFFPMVQRFELNVLWSIGLTMFVSQSFVAYFKTRAVLMNRPFISYNNTIRISFVLFAFVLSLSLIPTFIVYRKIFASSLFRMGRR